MSSNLEGTVPPAIRKTVSTYNITWENSSRRCLGQGKGSMSALDGQALETTPLTGFIVMFRLPLFIALVLLHCSSVSAQESAEEGKAPEKVPEGHSNHGEAFNEGPRTLA